MVQGVSCVRVTHVKASVASRLPESEGETERAREGERERACNPPAQEVSPAHV